MRAILCALRGWHDWRQDGQEVGDVHEARQMRFWKVTCACCGTPLVIG